MCVWKSLFSGQSSRNLNQTKSRKISSTPYERELEKKKKLNPYKKSSSSVLIMPYQNARIVVLHGVSELAWHSHRGDQRGKVHLWSSHHTLKRYYYRVQTDTERFVQNKVKHKHLVPFNIKITNTILTESNHPSPGLEPTAHSTSRRGSNVSLVSGENSLLTHPILSGQDIFCYVSRSQHDHHVGMWSW